MQLFILIYTDRRNFSPTQCNLFFFILMHLSMVCPTTRTWGQCGARWGFAPLNCNKSPPLGHSKQCNAPTYSIPYCQLSYILTFVYRDNLNFTCKMLDLWV